MPGTDDAASRAFGPFTHARAVQRGGMLEVELHDGDQYAERSAALPSPAWDPARADRALLLLRVRRAADWEHDDERSWRAPILPLDD